MYNGSRRCDSRRCGGCKPQKVQVVYLLQHPEAIACLVFDLPNSKISYTFNGFLVIAIQLTQMKQGSGGCNSTESSGCYFVKHKNDKCAPAVLQKLYAVWF